MHEVVITGIGVIGPHGVGIARIVEAANTGQLVFSSWPASAAPPQAESFIAPVGDYPKTRYFNERSLRLMDKPMMLASFAAGAALEDAGFTDGQAPPETATFLGTARSEQTSIHKFSLPLLQGRPERINPAEFPLVARNISCGQLAIRFGLQGPSSVLASGALSSLQAVARATRLIRHGQTRLALVGGVEALSRFALHFARHYYGDAALSGRPAFFGMQRGGLIPSEGACMLVLEQAEHAATRGARIYARVSGWRAGRHGHADPAATLQTCWHTVLQQNEMTAAGLELLLPAAGGARRVHEQQECQALQHWLTRESPQARLLAARALVGEGEAWASLLQVALAAHALACRAAPPCPSIAADASPPLAQAAAGGALQGQGSALVLGNDAAGSYCALHLRR